MADFKHIIRIANTDLDGNKPIGHALTKIKGIGQMLANSICLLGEIQRTKQTGVLSDPEIKKLNEIVKNPEKHFPVWMLNRRKDNATGEDKHLLISDLDFSQNNDIRSMQKIKCYRGMRHSAKLPCRGQRTRSNFRNNKGKVTGVKRKK